MPTRSTSALILILIAALLAGCAGPPAARELTVFAAASLTDAFTALAAAFEIQHPGVRVTLNFASSSALAAQITAGARADLFASANPRQMAVVGEAGLLAGEPEPFARNRLVLIVPAANPAGLSTLADLRAPGIRLVLAAPDVPARTYTEALLAALADDPAFGPEFVAGVLANVVSEESNVRQVAAKVALGEADAGFVYGSDVTAEHVRVIALPAAANPLATYPLARLKDAPQPDLAEAFRAYVLSPAGQAELARWGFLPLQEGAPA